MDAGEMKMAQWHLVSFHGQIPGDATMAARIFVQRLSTAYRASDHPPSGVIHHHQTHDQDHSYLIPPDVSERTASILKQYKQRTTVLADEPNLDVYVPIEL
jgi:hypothetical protein